MRDKEEKRGGPFGLLFLGALWLLGCLSGGLIASCRSTAWNERPLAPLTDRFVRNFNCSVSGKDCPAKVQYDAATDQSLFSNLRSMYEGIARRSTRSQKFYFADLTPYEQKDDFARVVAVCDKKRRDIFIDRLLWEQTDSLTQEILILHELGHCVGNLGHNENLLSIERRCKKKAETSLICFVERPQSIMHPHLFHSDLYDMFREEYHSDLRQMHGR